MRRLGGLLICLAVIVAIYSVGIPPFLLLIRESPSADGNGPGLTVTLKSLRLYPADVARYDLECAQFFVRDGDNNNVPPLPPESARKKRCGGKFPESAAADTIAFTPFQSRDIVMPFALNRMYDMRQPGSYLFQMKWNNSWSNVITVKVKK